MSTTAVTLFGSTEDKLPVPAHLAEFSEMDTNIITRERVPQLSFRGKVWRVVVDGEETIVTKGDGEPAAVVAGVIVDYNKARSRSYFAGGFDENKPAAPKCWSHDGVKPHSSVREPESITCAACPQSAKGSKVTDAGKEVTACSQFKRAAFVPLANLKHKPVLLKLPQTSIWDKDAEAEALKGFYAFDQYLDMLKRRGVNHTAQVVTKIKFDARTAYPKLLFGPMDWLPPVAVAVIKDHLADKAHLDKILSVDPEGKEADGAAAPAGNGSAAAPAPAAAPKAPPAPAKAPPPPKPAEEDDDAALMAQMSTEAKPAAPAVAKAPAPAAKAKPAAKAAPAAAPITAPAAEVVDGDSPKASGIGDLLSSWGDE